MFAFVLFFMTITAVKIYPFDSGEPGSYMRAYADVIFNDVFLIKGFRVLTSKTGGLFVGFPSQKSKDGKFRETVEFKSEELKSEVRSAILKAYKTYF
jgi:stage V sporulation protein G